MLQITGVRFIKAAHDAFSIGKDVYEKDPWFQSGQFLIIDLLNRHKYINIKIYKSSKFLTEFLKLTYLVAPWLMVKRRFPGKVRDVSQNLERNRRRIKFYTSHKFNKRRNPPGLVVECTL